MFIGLYCGNEHERDILFCISAVYACFYKNFIQRVDFFARFDFYFDFVGRAIERKRRPVRHKNVERRLIRRKAVGQDRKSVV